MESFVEGVITAIGTMSTTTKTIIEIVKDARSNSKNPEVEKSLSEALERILSLQLSMVDLQAKILSLQEENSQLREKIRQEETRARDRKQYQRKNLGRSWVLARADEPDVLFCPTCFEAKGQAIPLQDRNGPIYSSYYCPGCRQNY